MKKGNGGDKDYDALLERLAGVMTEKTDAAIAARIVLRDAVCEFVAVERDRGIPLSAVIATVTRILSRVQAHVNEAADELARRLVDWCLEFHPSRRVVAPAHVS